MSASRPDSRVHWWLNAVIVGGLVGFLPSAVGRTDGLLLLLPPLVVVLLVLVSVPGGYLDFRRLGGERWVALLAVPLLATYPVLTNLAASYAHSVWAWVVPGLSLWVAALLTFWPVIRGRGIEVRLSVLAQGVATTGLGVAGVGVGIARMHVSGATAGALPIMGGVGMMYVGMAQMAAYDKSLGFGAALVGLAVWATGTEFATAGPSLPAIGLVLVGVAAFSFGLAWIFDSGLSLALATFTGACGVITLGVGMLLHGEVAYGIAAVVLGASVAVWFSAALGRSRIAVGLAYAACGFTMIWAVLSHVRTSSPGLIVSGLGAGVASIAIGVVHTEVADVSRRLVRWLRGRSKTL